MARPSISCSRGSFQRSAGTATRSQQHRHELEKRTATGAPTGRRRSPWSDFRVCCRARVHAGACDRPEGELLERHHGHLRRADRVPRHSNDRARPVHRCRCRRPHRPLHVLCPGPDPHRVCIGRRPCDVGLLGRERRLGQPARGHHRHHHSPRSTCGSPEGMFLSRIVEVGWGVCVAVAIVWLAGRLPAAHANSQPRP